MVDSNKIHYTNGLYGEVIVGPPGSGKTSYCHNAYKFYKMLGRNVAIVNLDPANENMEYTCDIDIMKLITVEDVINSMHLGPNGALMYCMEFLDDHFDDWLKPALKKLNSAANYILFDCPGQVELYTHHTSMSRICDKLKQQGYQLVTVNLIDSHYCSEPTKFVATLLLALNMMLRLGLPHVNVLSKADLLKRYEDKLKFNLDFYTEVLDLNYLLEVLDDTPSLHKFKKLNAAICEMVENYSLVSFQLLNSRSVDSMLKLRNLIDKASGYIYKAGEEKSVNSLLALPAGTESETYLQENVI